MKFENLVENDVGYVVVADTLSTMFEGQDGLMQDGENLAVLQGLPLVYTSLEDAQNKRSLV